MYLIYMVTFRYKAQSNLGQQKEKVISLYDI